MRHLLTSILLASIFLINACKKTASNFNARITFLNAAINAGPVTVKFNNDVAISQDSFGVLKPFTTVPSGTFKVDFFVTPATVVSYSLVTNIESGRDYTCLVYDSVTKGKLFINKDVLPEKITEGKSAIRFFSLIPNTDNILLQNDTGKTFLSGKSFNNFTNAFEETDTTSLRLKIKMSGIIPALDSIFFPLKDQKKYTIFLTGSIGGTGVQKTKMIFLEHN